MRIGLVFEACTIANAPTLHLELTPKPVEAKTFEAKTLEAKTFEAKTFAAKTFEAKPLK